MATNNDANSRVFLYEVVIPPQIAGLNQMNGLMQRQGKFYLKVPYERMNEEMQRIIRLEGKIMKITSLSAIEAGPLDKQQDFPWWVEIVTSQPRCLYYFGPFESPEEAQMNKVGYIEDLQAEAAEGITVHIKQCQPEILTQELNG
ncbi:DUF1816 domain-containing protein [Aphanothece sacrum]|nr:DUF1816 domain-containing protein [Aphanothece sacrum]